MTEKKPVTEPKEKTVSNKKVILGVAFVILFILIGAASYYLGAKNKSQVEPSPTPIASPASTSTPEPETSANPTTTSPTPSPISTPTPSPTPEPETHTITLKSQEGHDGFRASNGGGNNSIEIRVGRNAILIIRGFLSFKLESIPSDATIEEAKLKVYQTNTTGNPYSSGLRVVVDHLDYGGDLNNAAYNAPSISASFATLFSNDSVGWQEINVTDRVRDDFDNSRPRSQYRLHMAVETIGGTGDFAYFESGENAQGTNNLPELTIKYH